VDVLGRYPSRKEAPRHRRLAVVLVDVALELNLCAFGNEAFTAFLATAFDDIASGFGGHAGAETVLLFAGTFRGLIGAEAHGVVMVKLKRCFRRGGGRLGVMGDLSMRQCVLF